MRVVVTGIQAWVLFNEPLVNLVTKLAVILELKHIRLKHCQELRKLRLLSDRQTLLENVVAKLVGKQVKIVIRVSHNASNHLLVDFLGVVLQTLLNDVAAELLFAEVDDVGH